MYYNYYLGVDNDQVALLTVCISDIVLEFIQGDYELQK